jgi:hypothetical protein
MAVQNRQKLSRYVLLANGVVDLLCTAFLVLLPSLHKAIWVYHVFDQQGAYMAGGWGMAALALGLTRIGSSNRPQFHEVMIYMGLCEGSALFLYTGICLIAGQIGFLQVLLPFCVGLLFTLLYIVCIEEKIRRKQ